MNTDIIDKFTTHLKNVLTRAQALVVETKEREITPLHLFWALATQKGSIAAEILRKAGVKEGAADALFKNKNAKLPLQGAEGKNTKALANITPKLGDAAKRAIEKAVLAANLYEHKYVGTEHLLAGLIQIEDVSIKEFLATAETDAKILRDQVTQVLKSTSKFPELASSMGVHGDDDHELIHTKKSKNNKNKKPITKTPALDFFSVDLTNPDIQIGIDPVIGRETEIERIMQILCRRTKNNPILLGDPGVGKTALVEGLAKKISQGEVPDALAGKRILSLDMSLIIAGTMYRGEFEGRLKQILDEVKAHPEIILFIDEVHTIIGAGSASGSLDAANILKPALARGEIRAIGATTTAEYKKHIESDPALERRFQSVIIGEPDKEKTVAILLGIKKNYEAYHNVMITKEAIVAAVDLAHRYLQDKFFPDKAIDLIDEAASSIKVGQKASGSEKKRRRLADELTRVREEKRQAVMEERFIEAISLKEKERQFEEEYKKLDNTMRAKTTGSLGRITARHIATVISRMTGIPLESLIDTERARLLELEERLERRVLGQDDAVKTVADFVRRAKTGIARPDRPLASFLFVGPSGVGKTELAKALAELVFDDPHALIRLDMSEFAEGFTVSKLIGAPAGYVGYKENAKLTDAVKHKPYSVVLFDELEKAHPDILNLLLQILDEGHITDATGRTVNFKNTIVIMTSNIGSEQYRAEGIGFGREATQAAGLLRDLGTAVGDRFRPEFLNRIDRICFFKTLSAPTLLKLVDLEMTGLNDRIAPHHLVVSLDPEVRSWIVEKGTRPEHGARAIRRVIQDTIEGSLATYLLEKKSTDFRRIRVVMKDGKPTLEHAVVRV